MNNKLLLAIATAIGITAMATTAVAAPLPAGTKLTITKATDAAFVGPAPGCTNGSCFGMFLFSSLYAWTPLGPGTDGGLIVGKAQQCGGLNSFFLPYDGELTEVWNFGDNWGTFGTYPGGELNLFDDASCTGAACLGRTELKYLYACWGGRTIPMGSANGCNPVVAPACTADQIAGIFVKSWTIDPAGTVPRMYRLTYNQVVPNTFTNYPFELVLAGKVMTGDIVPVVTVTPSVLTGGFSQVLTFTLSVFDPDGPSGPTCRVGIPPLNGVVQLTGCMSGTYTPDAGFLGTNSFTIVANDGTKDSVPFLVNVAIIPPTGPTYTSTPTPTCVAPAPSTVYVATTYGRSVNWYGNASFCKISQPPTYGTVTMSTETTCSGIYTDTNTPPEGFDTFVYTGTVADCGVTQVSGTVYVSVCPMGIPCPSPGPTFTPTYTATPIPIFTPMPMECTDQYPVSQITLTGKQGHLSVTVIGKIVSVNPNGKEIKICPTTTVRYVANTNSPGALVMCTVKFNTSRGQGHLKVNDHIKCTDKPVGNDKLYLKIKSGVNQKAM